MIVIHYIVHYVINIRVCVVTITSVAFIVTLNNKVVSYYITILYLYYYYYYCYYYYKLTQYH